MERIRSPLEDKIVFEVRGDMELAALALIVRGFAGIVRKRSVYEGLDAAIELEQTANNLAGRLDTTERTITYAGLLGINNPVVTQVIHLLDVRLGQVAEEAIAAFTLDPYAFMDHLNLDQMLEAQVFYPPLPD